jgi:hypothetical protein
VNKQEVEKILKYIDFTTEIRRKRNVKTVIPGIAAATGTISQSFSQYLSNIPGKHEIKEPKKTAIYRTAHILQKVLTQNYKTFNMGYTSTCTINCN